jgi:flavin reductase (DIM6/NTAB) family NADH-FMN oxidoreductase RutF
VRPRTLAPYPGPVSTPQPSTEHGGRGEQAPAQRAGRWSVPAAGAEFRRAVGRFATGVCVVSTVADGLDHAMTVNAFTSVSLDPLLVLVCVETDARFCDAVQASGQWAVSVLDAGARPAADWLATRGRPLQGQLDAVPHSRGPVTGSAVLESSSAWLECRTQAVHPGGDHLIVVGEVVSVGLGRDDTGALLYHRSAYRRLD